MRMWQRPPRPRSGLAARLRSGPTAGLRPGLSAGLLLACCLVAAPTPGRADDDGGVRSVFATGAGNRALALGGAFAAVADDASAGLYNPAGLGLIDRKELQASQTTLFGLGFSEQYAAFALPSWRWGTAGITWRRFGVDGIEERDERGFLLSADLEDSQTEVALGYGRLVGAGHLALGGSVKLQRQTLAGHSAAGLGVDLGVWSLPLALAGADASLARALAVGLTVRNAIEPELQLDQEPVSDPSGLRLGVAWRHAVGSNVELLLAADLEKTRGMDQRLHTGAECRVLDVLALRAGSAHGTLTAGAGLDWRGIGADYQYEDHPLGDVHRFGVSLRFGPTLQESRAAALAAAEADLQARLELAFVERNARREQDLVGAIQSALQRGHWRRALTLTGTLEVLAPAREDLAGLNAAAWRGLAAEQQQSGDLPAAAVSWRRVLALRPDDIQARERLAAVQAQSDARTARSREIRLQYSAALDAFAREDLLLARNGFAAVLQLAPDDADAAAMLARTEDALTRRAAALADEATSLAQAGAPEQARARLRDAERLDPGAPGVAAAAAEIADADRRQAAAARQAEASAPAGATRSKPGLDVRYDGDDHDLTPERRRELEALYRRGLQAMQAGRRDEAVQYWELVWTADPGHVRVREYLVQEYLARGMEAYAGGALRQAVAAWEQALRVTPDDTRARGYLERARQQLARMEKISAGR